jgi:hypothetical protein
MTEYEDQYAAAMNFLIRGQAREVVASNMFHGGRRAGAMRRRESISPLPTIRRSGEPHQFPPQNHGRITTTASVFTRPGSRADVGVQTFDDRFQPVPRRVKKMKLLKGDSFPIFLVSDGVSESSTHGQSV